ncbi:MAG TPA: sigma-E factor negative regulatory protein [Burkholderiaceae bacterium]|nr:sigma-E factor negative regulatory protein [Burkholderiaceae bacterium]
MATDSTDDAARERLSALVDGELEANVVMHACAAWHDAEQRSTWHAYQLIGDVLRSDDLASEPGRDPAFLRALRDRLAAEPVVLAPRPIELATSAEPSPGARHRGWTWVGASAAAAGFVAVAGVLVLTRTPSASPTVQPGASDSIALVAPPTQPTPVAAVQTTNSVTEPQALVANGKLIRDARLDRYLAAHKQFAGTSALGVPSGFLRSATTDGADR